MVSRGLKPPGGALLGQPGTILPTGIPINTFWGAGGCAGSFTVATASVGGGQGLSHNGGGLLGVEVTSVSYDKFPHPNFKTRTRNPCAFAPGCIRESAPPPCPPGPEIHARKHGHDVHLT